MITSVSRRRRHDRQRELPASDSGFLLIEVMVAIVVFALVAAAVLAGVIVSSNLTRTDRVRVAATHLADRELEIAKNAFLQNYASIVCGSCSSVTNPDPYPTTLPAGSNSVVNGTSYRITRTLQVLPQGNSGQSACSGGGSVTYPEYLVDVTVVWLHANGARPVEASTVLTPDKATVLSTSAGYVGVGVGNSSGGPVGGLTVTLTGPGPTVIGTTAADGCFVGTVTTAGTWAASISGPGYVDQTGNSPSTRPGVQVTIGQFSNVPMTWDAAATITATPTQPSGYSAPSSGFGLSVTNSGITQPSNSVRTYSMTNQATNLWPFSSGYSVWAGACLDADPDYGSNGGTRPASVATAPGASMSTTVQLAGLNVLIQKHSTGAAVVGAQLTLTHAADPVGAGCAAQTLTYSGVTDATGHLLVAVPLGTWKVTVNSQSAYGGTWPSAALLATALTTPATQTVTVN